MTQQFTDSDAVTATRQLLQLGENVDVVAKSAGGASKSVFKVVVPNSGTYAVRLKSKDMDDTLDVATKAVADLDLTPPFVIAGAAAVVQRWDELTPMPDWTHDTAWCQKIGHLCSQLHAIRIDSTVEREKARPADIAALVARLRPKLATGAGKILDLALATCATVEVPVQRGALVWTHGDLHYENLLLTAHGALNVIDFELVGARPRETDLSYLMFMSQLKNPAAALREDGRRALVTTYLTVGGVSRSRADVDALLLDIERETPLQAIWLYVLLLPLFPWSEQVDAWLSGAFATLADAIALLKRSAADETLKQRIVNNGLLTVARATVREN